MKHRPFHLLPLARAAALLLLSVSGLRAENGLRREVWHSLSAVPEESLAKDRAFLGRPLRLTTNPAYYAAPDAAEILASAISAPLGGTSFGARLRGYLTAPTTGDYRFWDGGGDTVAVYLSTDENPTGKRLIPQNQPLLVRYGADGPILGGGEVKSVCIRSNDKAGNIYESIGDPISTARLYVVVSGDLAGAEIRCNIVIGGVTFDDGSTTKSLWAADFDELGVGSLLFLKPNTAHANCRTFTVWKDGVCFGSL